MPCRVETWLANGWFNQLDDEELNSGARTYPHPVQDKARYGFNLLSQLSYVLEGVLLTKSYRNVLLKRLYPGLVVG